MIISVFCILDPGFEPRPFLSDRYSEKNRQEKQLPSPWVEYLSA